MDSYFYVLLILTIANIIKEKEECGVPTGIESVYTLHKIVFFLGVAEVMLTIIGGYITIVI